MKYPQVVVALLSSLAVGAIALATELPARKKIV